MVETLKTIWEIGGPLLVLLVIIVIGYQRGFIKLGKANGKQDPFQQLGSKIEKCSEEIKDEIAKNGQNVEILFGQIRDNRNSLEQVVKFTDKSEIPSRDYFERLEKMIYKQTLLFEELLRKLE